MAPRTSQVAEMVKSIDLWAVALLEGSLSAEATDDRVIIISLKNIGLNLTTLPNEYLHMLLSGVIVELRSQE